MLFFDESTPFLLPIMWNGDFQTFERYFKNSAKAWAPESLKYSFSANKPTWSKLSAKSISCADLSVGQGLLFWLCVSFSLWDEEEWNPQKCCGGVRMSRANHKHAGLSGALCELEQMLLMSWLSENNLCTFQGGTRHLCFSVRTHICNSGGAATLLQHLSC